MRVVAFPGDAWACGHYRVIWPCYVIQAMHPDWEIFVVPPNGKAGFQVNIRNHPDGRQELVSMTAPDCDVVLLQRPAHEWQPQMIAALRSHGIAVVVDMDDDMSSINQNHIAFSVYSTRSNSKFSWRTAMESCKLATLVTTSTKELLRTYAPHGRGMVLDNYLPAQALRWETSEPEPGFGWAGTVASHPDDLQVVGKSVQKLIDEGHMFRVVGDGKKLRGPLQLKDDPWATGGVQLEDWVKRIQETIQVGMVPLAPTSFNASKSRLKGIEYMAANVPWVASPRAEYRKLQREAGVGLLADTPKEWYNCLKRLLTDPVLRKEQVEAGREYMKDQTFEAQAWRWATAWQEAVDMQRRGRRG